MGASIKSGEAVVTLADTRHLWLDVEVFSQQPLGLDAWFIDDDHARWRFV